MDKALVIIPAYNEADSIGELLDRCAKHADLVDVVVVNDASSDDTRAIVEARGDTQIINHVTNTHIPGGVLDGMRHALANNYRWAIAMDAGLSHNPDDIPQFYEQRDHDVVMGRRIGKSNTPMRRHLLSAAGNFLYNYALDPRLIIWKRTSFGDLTSGYRLYSKKCMELLLSRKMEARSFDFIIEAMMFAYRNGLKVTEIPIHYEFTGSSLNKRVIKDALRMLSLMISQPNRK
ncbi:MAG: dolichol-phosphate mannosyltransferase [Pseudohongiellaceae bacterium]|jgi:dolichol-phosphate mannosyltransferase